MAKWHLQICSLQAEGTVRTKSTCITKPETSSWSLQTSSSSLGTPLIQTATRRWGVHVSAPHDAPVPSAHAFPVKTSGFKANSHQTHSPWTATPGTEGAASHYPRQIEHLPLSLDNPLISVASKIILLTGLHAAQLKQAMPQIPG